MKKKNQAQLYTVLQKSILLKKNQNNLKSWKLVLFEFLCQNWLFLAVNSPTNLNFGAKNSNKLTNEVAKKWRSTIFWPICARKFKYFALLTPKVVNFGTKIQINYFSRFFFNLFFFGQKWTFGALCSLYVKNSKAHYTQEVVRIKFLVSFRENWGQKQKLQN